MGVARLEAGAVKGGTVATVAREKQVGLRAAETEAVRLGEEVLRATRPFEPGVASTMSKHS